MKLDGRSASDFPVPDLLQLLNLSFEKYIVPVNYNLQQFLTMIRRDSMDLSASRVLFHEGQPVGIALIARRGWTSRLAAMGIVPGMRGRGLGRRFMESLIRDARKRRDREMVLEVIEQNEPAVQVYQRGGFKSVRRLIGFIRRNAREDGVNSVEEFDLRAAGRLISQYGWVNLPWQLDGETIAHLTPPARAYRNGHAYVVLSDPDAAHVAIWSLLVEPKARGNHLGANMIRRVIAKHPGKTWHLSAIFPEEIGQVFDETGFEKEPISQWQMSLKLS